ncbi:MAG: hypothetical protein H6748_09975 [Spirochaetaceae bacterium]|nr:hypothetical protein [Myxococcales bacterium]MCB9724361.1 hypothetical protein [Spirochaetaceae bacterium]
MSTATTAPERANPGALPQPVFNLCIAFIVIGLICFGVGLAKNPQATWLAYHTNFIYFTFMACGGLVLTAIYTIVGAYWPGPYRRFAEALAAFLPIAFVLGLVGIAGGEHIFDWQANGAMHGKEGWLTPTRFYVMDMGLLGALALLSVLFIKASVRPTLRNLAENGTGFAKRMAESWTAGWKGDEEERVAAKSRTSFLAPIIALIYGLGFAFFAFDQVMSMEQAWFSNLFGNFVCWGGILSAVAACALSGLLSRDLDGFQGQITQSRMHDIGKMMFAFSIFWMYLFWSQYLVIYYGNLPEETYYLRDRLGDQFLIDKGYSAAAFAKSWGNWDFQWARLQTGYGWVSMAAWACNWLIPFWVLLGQRPKKTPWIAGPVAATLLFGLWLERNLLVWPSVVKGDMLAPFGGIQIGIALGFLGAFLMVVLFYSRVFPTVAVSPED